MTIERLRANPELLPNSSYAQKIELEKIRITHFDRFNGEQIAHDLEDNRHLWVAALMTSYLPYRDRMELEALKFGTTHYDTLLVWTTPIRIVQLEELAERWNPDSIDRINERDLDPGAVDLPNFMDVVRVSWWADGRGANFQNEKHAMKFNLRG